MCNIGPHIYVGADSTSRVQSPCLPTADVRASEIRIVKALCKCGVDHVCKASGVALIHCLADVNDSRHRDQVKVLPNPGSQIFLSLCTLMICLGLRHKNFVPFFKSSFKS